MQVIWRENIKNKAGQKVDPWCMPALAINSFCRVWSALCMFTDIERVGGVFNGKWHPAKVTFEISMFLSNKNLFPLHAGVEF